ncbi:MAG: 3-dehydroquinate synthase family protein [Bacteroidales bacterium]|nr:3-dehydroquinate synthase family protein [Bacteroidales bacterium]
MKCKIYSGQKITDVAGYLKGYPAVFVVADRQVKSSAEQVVKAHEEQKPEGTLPHPSNLFLLDVSEENKSMSTVLEICKWLMDNDAGRNALLLAIGGGITTDMAGFAASIYKRGIRFAYVPTTFLSQVDAAIGGKTGVNFQNYKNILGVIRQPEFTYICPEVLGTLPYRDFLSGTAELLKTFIIDNAGNNYEKAVEVLSEIHESIDRKKAIVLHLAEIEELAAAAAKIKAGIVERDEFECGERRKLNLGHTFAHAIESVSMSGRYGAESGISHGEAVAMGMIMAAKASERHYNLAPENSMQSDDIAGQNDTATSEEGESLSSRLVRDFSRCGLPTECPFPPESLSGAMKKDKKAENGIVHFVLIRAIGDVRIEDLTVESAVNL